MILTDEAAERRLSPAAVEDIIARHTAVGRELRAAGKWIDAGRLRFSDEAVTVRRSDESYVVVDGPFAETRETLGGFYLIEAASKDEAIGWAKMLPLREAGAIEVRPARSGATWRGETRGAQRYLLLLVGDTGKPQTREDVLRAIEGHYELSLDMVVRGRFAASRALEPISAATTLRWREGTHVVTDGPFVESREFLAGYFVIACDSRDEAIAWAKPLLSGNTACEVRRIWE